MSERKIQWLLVEGDRCERCELNEPHAHLVEDGVVWDDLVVVGAELGALLGKTVTGS